MKASGLSDSILEQDNRAAMDIKQINQTLTRMYKEEKKRIVFWYDGEKEFEDSLPAIQIEGVTLLRLDEIGALDLKIRLEIQDNRGQYLLYGHPEA